MIIDRKMRYAKEINNTLLASNIQYKGI